MKKQYFLNANIVDPDNSIEELGGLIISEDGKIEAIGKKVNKNNIPSREKFVDLKEKYIFPGLIDMRVFVGEPGFEYKENFKTLSNAALASGVTSVVTMPNNIEKLGVNIFSDMKKGLKDCDIVMMLRLQNERMSSSYLSSNREYYEYYGLTPDTVSYTHLTLPTILLV